MSECLCFFLAINELKCVDFAARVAVHLPMSVRVVVYRVPFSHQATAHDLRETRSVSHLVASVLRLWMPLAADSIDEITRHEGLIGDKDVSAIGRLECDAEAVFLLPPCESRF
jgi:hypothetical protein